MFACHIAIGVIESRTTGAGNTPMKEIGISHSVWKIVVHVRLSLDDPTKWIGTYQADAPGHLPHKGVTGYYDQSDRALDRALGDALRDVVRN